jgi:hypothetical protein
MIFAISEKLQNTSILAVFQNCFESIWPETQVEVT